MLRTFYTLRAMKKAVEKGSKEVCPDFILQSYKNFRIRSFIKDLQAGVKMIEL